jgi:uncharacterized repeat protein (TIGR03803 family)
LTDAGNVSGSATPTLTITAVNSTNVATFSVIVSNVTGVAVSSNATLSLIASAPVFVLQPTNQSVLPGGPATLSVAVVGSTPYHYQWQFNGANLAASSTKYPSGVTNASLSIVNFVTANAGNYTVVVTNSLGSVTSSVAALSLTPVTAPGFNLTANASFSATSTQPQNPYAGVVYVSSQSAYFGTTENGGANGGGATYKVTTAGTITREHSFAGGTDGAFPVAPLLLARDGYLYGVSFEYGTYSDGSLWKELPTSTSVTALTQFNGDNGAEPVSGLVQGQGADNNLYGAANVGGAYGKGTIFRATTAGALTTLISFNGADGAFPSPILAQGTDGYLYGTTESGGIYASDAGTIFRISTNGAFTVLHDFNGTNDGAVPIAGLTLANDGNFYGTTLLGGAYNEGTVFQITPSGAFTTLYSFTGGPDGAEPWGGLVQASNGNLYGNTQQGGTYGYGTVFQISPAGSYTTVAELDGFQGATPEGNLVQGPDGNLYGTTYNGGQNGYGAFFSITNFGALQITGQPLPQSVYAGANALFTVATSGSAALSYQWQENGTNLVNGSGIFGANSSVLLVSNIVPAEAGLYSVIVSNVYNSVTSTPALLTVNVSQPLITSQPASETVVAGVTASFSVTAAGDAPLTYQWQDNGVNLADGAGISGSAKATLTLASVSLASAGTYSVIVSNALGGVTSSNALLTVVPASVASVTFTNLHFFTNGPGDGSQPDSALIQGRDGNLYGTASSGGSSYEGTIFRATLAGAFTNYLSFTGTANGAYPNAGLVQGSNGNLYGTTQQGGANSDGALFSLANYTTLSLLHSFGGAADGQSPVDSLVQGSDGNLYGTAFEGGAHGDGSVFQLLPNGTVNLLYSFTGGADGSHPIASLIQGPDGSFYGTTVNGGLPNNYGTVFKIRTNGVLTTLVTFNSTNGSFPDAGLVLAKDGNFYGTTAGGGANGNGTVYRLSTNGTLTTIFSFADTNGDSPEATLIQGKDGNLYGTTFDGGIGGNGTVFLITTNGALTTLLWFDGLNGSGPEAALLQASDGNLYGTTYLGGSGYYPFSGGGNGSIFKITLPTLVPNGYTAPQAVASLPYSGSLIGKLTPPAGDTFSYSIVSGPAWLSTTTNGVLSGTPANANIGTNTFVIGVTDASGFVASTNLSLVVIADPAPTFTSNPFAEPSANAGVAYSGSIATNATATYAGLGDVVAYALVSGPAWLSVASNGALSGTPADSDGGTNTFVVSATDLGGSSNTATLVIYVNSHPVFTSTSLASATAGFAYSGSLTSNVADAPLAVGDTLTFSEISGPAWLAVGTGGALSGTPGAGDVGANTVTVEAIDSDGLTATASLTLIVNADVPPSFVLNPFTAPPATAGIAYATGIASNAVEAIPGDTLTFGKVTGPAWLNIATNGVLSGTPGVTDVGIDNFVVSATDLAGVSNTFTLLITVSADAPVITVPADITVQATNVAGNVVDFTVTASDVVDGTLTPTVTPASGSIFPLGTNLVTATATDSLGLSATNTFNVIVVDTNLPVIVSEPVSVTNLVGTSASFTVVAIAYSPLSYQWYLGATPLSGQTNSTLTLPSVGPGNVGAYTVAVTSDGGTTNSAAATLTLIYPNPPLITVPSDITVQATNIAGNEVFFAVTATDAMDGVIIPTVTPASGSTFPLGTNLVTATATDSLGLSATNTFNVIVVDTNLPVIVSQPLSLTNIAGTTASFTVEATAFSPLSYQWFFGTNAMNGQTNTTLTLSPVGPTNAGSYQVAVTSQGGTTNSLPATLTVVYQAPNIVAGPSVLGTNGFQFSFSGPTGQTYEVLASGDLTVPQQLWTPVGTGIFGSTNVIFTDPNATNIQSQYYIIKSP